MQAKDFAAIAYSAEPQVLTVSVLKSLEEAAELLYEDYKSNRDLTEFTQLDGESFYEAK